MLVLIPGGTFHFGAQSGDEFAQNYDPQALEEEGPVQSVTLDPYLISKYELTQGQWIRFRAINPSRFLMATNMGDRPITALNPVEEVSWKDSRELLHQLGLELPTEAQWEFAARAGTDTPWSTGPDRESLVGHANISDLAAQAAGEPFAQRLAWPEYDDGYAVHAPAGTYLANGFGLHEMHGNVMEWCLDLSGSNYLPVRPGDGLRLRESYRFYRCRGGSFTGTSGTCRVTSFRSSKSEYRFTNLGVRPARALRP